jgi:hypothetical protein
MTDCAHVSASAERLCRDGDTSKGEGVMVTFGTVPVCSSCRAVMGEVKLDRKLKTWTATSWALMQRVHPFPPFNFKMDKAGKMLVPSAYTEEEQKQ